MLAAVVTPFLDMISKYTGFENMTLLCGSAPSSTDPEANFMISAVHYGKTVETVPSNFYEHESEAFRLHIIPAFCNFLEATRAAGTIQSSAKLPENLDLSLTISEDDDTSTITDDPPAKPIKPNPTMDSDGDRPRRETRASTQASTEATAATSTTKRLEKMKVKISPKPKIRLRPDASAHLVRKTNALPDAEREKEIARLNTLPDMELRWENSDAAMGAIFGSEDEVRETVSVTPSASATPVTTALPTADTTSTDTATPPIAPTTPTVTSSATEAVSADAQSTASTCDNNTEVPVHIKEPESPLLLPTNSDSLTLPAHLPPWVKEHADRLLETPMLDEVQATWSVMIHDWVRIEEIQGYKTPRDGFLPTHRPSAIGLWVQNARRKTLVVQPSAYEDFTKE